MDNYIYKCYQDLNNSLECMLSKKQNYCMFRINLCNLCINFHWKICFYNIYLDNHINMKCQMVHIYVKTHQQNLFTNISYNYFYLILNKLRKINHNLNNSLLRYHPNNLLDITDNNYLIIYNKLVSMMCNQMQNFSINCMEPIGNN